MISTYFHHIKDNYYLKESFLKKHPEIKKPLNKLENKISDEDMQMMNVHS